ncbi:hypothetical protein WICANDRAFT_56036 [Wickerhamomyces anomalus NRRL Y-366-8]|uniref:FYVE-type domain-containing protein n=1 Tax=Wickerhamomyces anomalus (strain ATCC 58044 / CBS 1984 / NCYC 433 / NRRL Y-366-8) TaxID=683960 RepID=A0A1E3P397_WICAA|nr:uncharacterized protein WICANDRAFT_56036 [Wickerhamomyces anomalus NRRL Y-366-8]ODQ59372.1 hypothetical protein WICANDRAFT_56036 [Wickerhamomyces anomalus NRRL Y-366-8]
MSSDNPTTSITKAPTRRVLGAAPKRILGVPKSPSHSKQSSNGSINTPTPSPLKIERRDSPALEDHITPVKAPAPVFINGGANTPDILLSEADVIDGVSSPDPFIERNLTSPQPDAKSSDENLDEITCPICDEKMISLLQLNRHLDDEHKFQDAFESSSSSLNTVTPEITVTRKHWQKPSGYDRCFVKGCKKHLNIKNGLVNCRKCGKLFCHDHSDFRVKLDNNADYYAEGVWCKCCEDCFKYKPGYNDYGLVNNLTEQFKQKRQSRIDEKQLYANKLEKRIINLTKTLSQIDKEFGSTDFNSNFLNYRIINKKREAEQQLVQWEDEKLVLNCFLCLRNFSFTLRKHHCRLCGRVVCGSETTGCSKEIPVNILTELLQDLPKTNDDSLLRLCRNCKNVLFLKRNFQKDLRKPFSKLLAKFEIQQNVKKSITTLMPRFQDMLIKLQDDKAVRSKSIIADASKLRKRLMDTFAMFDKLTKEIVTLECSTESESRIQLAIQTESASFIQKNMLPLKSLPKILKQQELKQKEQHKVLSREEVQGIKQNREELMVLNEQKFLVEDMIANCKAQRKFDELPPLNENLDELNKNIDRLQAALGNEGF